MALDCEKEEQWDRLRNYFLYSVDSFYSAKQWFKQPLCPFLCKCTESLSLLERAGKTFLRYTTELTIPEE